MTNVEKQNESSRPRGFEALSTKSTWSSFDDITWDDFNGDDHSVPEPEEPSSQPWLRGRREMKAMKDEAPTGAPGGEDDSPMDVDDWDVAELGAVPENLILENDLIVEELKQDEESPALLPGGLGLEEQVYTEQDDSPPARFTYIPAEEEMGLFGNENDVDKGGTLLGYSWDNLEDMDNLFQNEENAFVQDATDSLIQWPPSSSSSPDSAAVVNATAAKPSPELRAMKGKSLESDVKMEFIPCERLRSSSEVCANNSEVCANNSETEAMDDHAEVDAATHSEYSKCSSDSAAEDHLKPLPSLRTRDVSSVDKVLYFKTWSSQDNTCGSQAHKHRQGSHRRDRLKKQVYLKKPGQPLIQPKQQALTHYSSAQLKPGVASSLQVYPQVMGPGVVSPGMLGVASQRGQYLGPVHHSPYLLQGSVCFEHPEAHPFEDTRQKIEALAPPPVSGSNMTPQEKIEKLRWKQKMHRLASEQQQQQQFAKQQCMSLDPPSKLKQGKNPGKKLLLEADVGPASMTRADEPDARFVEATVLSQLLTIMSKLDVGTRICIRDALYRLAKSAANRHSVDGASSSECSNTSADDRSLSRAFRYPVLETETNLIDRTIANLLFHKRNTGGNLLVLPEGNPLADEAGAPEKVFTPGGGVAGGDQSTDLSSDDRESEGSSRKIEKLKASSDAPRSGLKREASCEFLSSQEDRGRGASITSRGDSPRDGKAAKTGIQ